MAPRLAVAAVAVLVTGIVLAVVRPGGGFHSAAFARSTWQHHPSSRGAMLEDLLCRGLVRPEMSGVQVVSLLGRPEHQRVLAERVTDLEYEVGRYGGGTGDPFVVKLIAGKVDDVVMPAGSKDGIHPPDYPPGRYWKPVVLRDFALAQMEYPKQAAAVAAC